MAETKTVQKGWRFSPATVAMLKRICERWMRSEQNMVDVLIRERFIDDFGPDAVIMKDSNSTLVNGSSGVTDVNS